jgi:hypothetical protein
MRRRVPTARCVCVSSPHYARPNVASYRSNHDIHLAAWFCVLDVLSDETSLTVVVPPPNLPGATNCTAQQTEASLAKRCCALAPPTTASAFVRLRLYTLQLAISSSAYEDIRTVLQPGQLRMIYHTFNYMNSSSHDLIANSICIFRKWQIHFR